MKKTLIALTVLMATHTPAYGAQNGGQKPHEEKGALKELHLPDFGRSANSGVSEKDEYYYGQQLLRAMRNAGVLIEDPQIDEYLRTLATRLGEASSKPDENFTYVLLNDQEFNAFAVPGGLIAVHAGLWLQAASESELAAVLSHETAHVTQKHVVRAMERTQKASLPIMLGTLAAMVAASQAKSSTYSPYDSPNRVDNAIGAMVAGQALLQQLQINFTRDNEFEADRVGIQTLKKAGFDVTAMASMFERMQTTFRTGSSSAPPQFLQTHPISTTRIAEAKTRASELLGKPVFDDGVAFAMVRERVRVMQLGNTKTIERFYRDSLATRPRSPALNYGFALLKIRQNDYEGARALCAQLPDTKALGLMKQLLLVDIEFADKTARWQPMYDALLAANPKHRVIAQKYASALLSLGSKAGGEKALSVLRDLNERYDNDPTLFEQLSRAYELSGDNVRAGEAYANATALRGAFEDALLQLQTISEGKNLSYYERARLDAQIAELTPLVLELKARNIDTRSGGPSRQLQGATQPAAR
jgi:beta-barrel assembly-enhancing protease